MKPKAKSRTSAQITGDHFLKLGLAEMREFVEYVADKPDGKDALTILEQRISDQRKADLRAHNEDTGAHGSGRRPSPEGLPRRQGMPA